MKGIKPENILAITFTQKAAEEMIVRTTEIIGDIYDLKISTFHSFCDGFLQANIFNKFSRYTDPLNQTTY